ncbi:serine/threonine protein phosphatase 4 regulatory subunit-like protein [Dinothrombium tinctorium]|uniref:Serine/threonine protein phosphatase 4 regulatory subunit-like protein n=1 Tax=Dinothrombium tinctorium TaxID=1965070 RepID=A0A443RFN1_9ACAR|nr:serine/threonine protein phosphatase 4 regulatory subunit-like protein [Dinothrombium tinctorium]
MDLDKEAVLDELTDFEKKNGECNKIPDILEKYLLSVARTGDPVYPWHNIRALLRRKIELVINEFNEKYPANNIPDLPNVKRFDFDEMKKDILDTFDVFNGSPFTIQRICELLTAPYKHYKRIDKFMRGLEKNVLVVSTIEPKSAKVEPFNIDHKSLFLSTSSSTSYQSPSSSSSYMNGISDNGATPQLQSDYCSSRLSMSPNSPSSPAPLQQLDSFTTVFASPPSTPLAVCFDTTNLKHEENLSEIPFSESKLETSQENLVPSGEFSQHEKENDTYMDKPTEKEESHPDVQRELQTSNPTESLDNASTEMETEVSTNFNVKNEYNISEVLSEDDNAKLASDEIRLVTEHLKEAVAAEPQNMEESDSSFQ